jgi:hypothetical protein
MPPTPTPAEYPADHQFVPDHHVIIGAVSPPITVRRMVRSSGMAALWHGNAA